MVGVESVVPDGTKLPLDEGFLVGGGLLGPAVFLHRQHRLDGCFEVEAPTTGGVLGEPVKASDIADPDITETRQIPCRVGREVTVANVGAAGPTVLPAGDDDRR